MAHLWSTSFTTAYCCTEIHHHDLTKVVFNSYIGTAVGIYSMPQFNKRMKSSKYLAMLAVTYSSYHCGHTNSRMLDGYVQ